MTTTFIPSLVIASVLIAIWGSVASLAVSSRIRASTGRVKIAWLTLAAVCLGSAIWSMHFVAMLAYRVHNILVYYDLLLTLISLLLPIAASVFGFWFMHMTRKKHHLIAGTVFGTAIVGMHYTGMAAMVMNATQTYNYWLVALSYAIAVVASIVALQISTMHIGLYTLLGASVVMGLAISGMHYTGMWALTLVPSLHHVVWHGINWEMVALWIGTLAMFLFNGSIIAVAYDSLAANEL